MPVTFHIFFTIGCFPHFFLWWLQALKKKTHLPIFHTHTQDGQAHRAWVNSMLHRSAGLWLFQPPTLLNLYVFCYIIYTIVAHVAHTCMLLPYTILYVSFSHLLILISEPSFVETTHATSFMPHPSCHILHAFSEPWIHNLFITKSVHLIFDHFFWSLRIKVVIDQIVWMLRLFPIMTKKN